ncbi:MAG: dihydrofolate reductase [Rikenellaceae bacterium]|nr:dihydrofolate reductase [Rikenellaceae bacterium]MCL2693406.1 dihydrofolate reductase [Rikenellaceae bacterium]
MKKVLIAVCMGAMITGLAACGGGKKQELAGDFRWIIDTFDDIRILRYQVPGFEELPLDQKLFIYYMGEAALAGRDILFDQNCYVNLAVRRTLEDIYLHADADRTTAEWDEFEKYLKKVWFGNGIHHHHSGDKFVPGFSEEYFNTLVGDNIVEAHVRRAIFDPAYLPLRVNQAAGVDVLLESAMNYYCNVSQREAEDFYAQMSDPRDLTPPSWGLNSQLVKENGRLFERVWRVGGMYSPAIERIIGWLEKAAAVATPAQRAQLASLISYYRSGDLREFDRFSILWVEDTESNTDFINGFIETYGDPLGYKASWEAIVNFKNVEATQRTAIISDNAQWFEDNSPIDDRFKKDEVRGVSAKVITATMLGGDLYPATAIGINLPNADWIRRDHGSKSVTIQNITDAYAEAARGDGFNEEFVLRKEDRERINTWGRLAGNLLTDMHECLGHGSGQLAPGVRGDELRQYGAVLEEVRADLFALYFIADPKMKELGLIPTLDVAKAAYARYMMNGYMTQLVRIQPGKNVEQAHMRNRKLIAEWIFARGAADGVVERVVENGRTYIVVNDFERLRGMFGELLHEVQRIKSEGDFEAGQQLVERYAIQVDPVLHAEVLERYARLGIQPYQGFVNPEYHLVMENGEIVDVEIRYTESYVEQMLRYSRDYSFLPTVN